MKWRFWFLMVGTTFLYGALAFNLYRIQVERGATYTARAHARADAASPSETRRGNIYFTDKNGARIPAAINREFFDIFAVPEEIPDPRAAAKALAPSLGISEEKLTAQLSKTNDEYELLVPKANQELVARLEPLKLPGIYVDRREYRFYPSGTIAAHVLGFVGANSEDDTLRGRYGVERQFDGLLSGDGNFLGGGWLLNIIGRGNSIALTIDRNIQARAEEILSRLIEEQDAAGGSVIVEEPSTGRILALANQPAFDPNRYSEFPLASFPNAAAESVYEPGSIFKVITMAVGLDRGAITPETAYEDRGSLTLDGKTITNWDGKAHGRVTMREVIEQSINTGAAFAEKQIGHDAFYQYLVRFGLEEPTGIALPGEVAGSLRNLVGARRRDINFATAAFGQGVAVTPIRLAFAIAAIANGGVIMKPLIASDEKPEQAGVAVSAAAARSVTEMMVSAVKKAGVAHIPGYRVAGKTGTAQVPDFKRGGYTEEFIHSYAGFAPALNPRFMALIKLDKPQGAELAGATVVPAFRELAEFILNYYGVPPDDLPESGVSQ